MVDDRVLPPARERETLTELPPANDDAEADFGDIGGFDAPVPVIPAGQAQRALSNALDQLAAAYALVEGLSMSLARVLDAQATQGTP